jgi:hypothetical protein
MRRGMNASTSRPGLLSDARRNALTYHGPTILKNLQLSDEFYILLRSDYTLTQEMEETIKV